MLRSHEKVMAVTRLIMMCNVEYWYFYTYIVNHPH